MVVGRYFYNLFAGVDKVRIRHKKCDTKNISVLSRVSSIDSQLNFRTHLVQYQ